MNKLKLIYTYLPIAMLLLTQGCVDDEGDNGNQQSVNQVAFLQNSSKLISEALVDAEYSTTQLKISGDNFIKSPNTNGIQKLRTELKRAWKDWQKISFYEFGKAEQIGLKSNVNVYKTDTSLIESNIRNVNFNLDQLSMKSAKGFPAIDYLINNNSETESVTAFINDSTRGTYLAKIIEDINSKINDVSQDFNANQSAFETNTGTDVGSSTGMLVNALNQHYEKYFRDNKIGIPLGVRSSGIAHPDFCEAFYGEYSVELAIENFQAMKNFYLGVDSSGVNGYGLDDYLHAIEAGDLNTTIQNTMDVIDLKLTALSDPLSNQITNNPQAVQDSYTEIQKLIVFWKVDLPSRMGILITYQDTDGD